MFLTRLNSLLIFLRLRRSDPWSPRTPLDWILYSPLQWLAALLYRNRQVDWLKSLPHRWKVVIGGNHDLCLDKSFERKLSSAGRHDSGEKVFDEQERQQQEVNWGGIEYLCDRAVELRFEGGRRLNVYGWGAVPGLGEDHALSYPRHRHPWHRRIPDETDVLVTHTPPAHHLDLGLGCAGLLDEVWRVKPRLHVFGHVHRAHGTEPVYYDECQRAYEAIMSRRPQGGPLRDLLLPGPHWLDVWDMVRHGIASILWKWIMLGPGTNNGGLMVNAALMYGDSGVLRNPITVVDL
ncbi:hypothetical protein VTJ49DRAFT_758 [Mycothermus thermophilus]|uniref:Calcineurin-like phosphoesterase domain-containing protein n=1 Tax=Humicola insolens TaxID=85995 RepID=A0ABR3VEK6_HUMIN